MSTGSFEWLLVFNTSIDCLTGNRTSLRVKVCVVVLVVLVISDDEILVVDLEVCLTFCVVKTLVVLINFVVVSGVSV